ncbi:hypothetical protein HHI36_016999 [Cryptolaemus montrouzieri]|uniref:Uncharacterized protein n=1 Tax=Cryptolaemus montrouzieri TaxID=559131 RepID=A0ABD2NLK1_9CUCU
MAENDSTESSNIKNDSDPDFVFYSDASDESSEKSLESIDQNLAENASNVINQTYGYKSPTNGNNTESISTQLVLETSENNMVDLG